MMTMLMMSSELVLCPAVRVRGVLLATRHADIHGCQVEAAFIDDNNCIDIAGLSKCPTDVQP